MSRLTCCCFWSCLDFKSPWLSLKNANLDWTLDVSLTCYMCVRLDFFHHFFTAVSRSHMWLLWASTQRGDILHESPAASGGGLGVEDDDDDDDDECCCSNCKKTFWGMLSQQPKTHTCTQSQCVLTKNAVAATLKKQLRHAVTAPPPHTHTHTFSMLSQHHWKNNSNCKKKNWGMLSQQPKTHTCTQPQCVLTKNAVAATLKKTTEACCHSTPTNTHTHTVSMRLEKQCCRSTIEKTTATVKKHLEGCCHSNPKHTHALNLNAFWQRTLSQQL